MVPAASTEVTALLKAWRGGDAAALDRLTPIVYDHLRRLGRQYVRNERAGGRGDASRSSTKRSSGWWMRRR